MSSEFPARVVHKKKSGQCFRSFAGFKDYMIKEKHIEPRSRMWGGRDGGKVIVVFFNRNHSSWTDAQCSQLGAPADQKASSLCRAGGEAAPSHTHFGRI